MDLGNGIIRLITISCASINSLAKKTNVNFYFFISSHCRQFVFIRQCKNLFSFLIVKWHYNQIGWLQNRWSLAGWLDKARTSFRDQMELPINKLSLQWPDQRERLVSWKAPVLLQGALPHGYKPWNLDRLVSFPPGWLCSLIFFFPKCPVHYHSHQFWVRDTHKLPMFSIWTTSIRPG